MNVLVGTFQGQLMNYVIKENAQRQINHKLLHVDENFSKKPIDQMDVVAGSKLLFSLTDNVFSIHRICNHRFEFVKSLVEKNVSLFAWSSKRLYHSADLISIRICVVIEQQVKIWHWDLERDKFNPYHKSIRLDSTAKSIACHKNDICIATEIGYTIYDVNICFVWCLKFKIWNTIFLFNFRYPHHHEKPLTYQKD